jgi:hypothetical protein
MGFAVLRWNVLVSIATCLCRFQVADQARYVAMHSMTEATNTHEEPVINGYISHHTPQTNGLSKSDIAIVLSGMLVPLLTQVGHHH